MVVHLCWPVRMALRTPMLLLRLSWLLLQGQRMIALK